MIIYADDQYVNRLALKLTFEDIGLIDRFVSLTNGQEVLDYIDKVLEDLTFDTAQPRVQQPISLILLDINMPILHGLETLPRVMHAFREINNKLPVLRPLICYLSQYDGTIKTFIKVEEEEADCFVEKPLSHKELVNLLEILKIC